VVSTFHLDLWISYTLCAICILTLVIIFLSHISSIDDIVLLTWAYWCVTCLPLASNSRRFIWSFLLIWRLSLLRDFVASGVLTLLYHPSIIVEVSNRSITVDLFLSWSTTSVNFEAHEFGISWFIWASYYKSSSMSRLTNLFLLAWSNGFNIHSISMVDRISMLFLWSDGWKEFAISGFWPSCNLMCFRILFIGVINT